jgi:hypothetical protein
MHVPVFSGPFREDVTAALLHDPVDRGEAHAEAPPLCLGREERLEGVRGHSRLHAAPVSITRSLVKHQAAFEETPTAIRAADRQ